MAKLPTLIVDSEVVLPLTIKELTIEAQASLLTIKEATENYNNKLILIPQKNTSNNEEDVLTYGILAKIIKISDVNKIKIIVEGVKRISITEFENDDNDVTFATYVLLKETQGSKKTISEIRKVLEFSLENNERLPFDIDASEVKMIKELNDSNFIDRFASIIPISIEDKTKLLSISKLDKRYMFIVERFTQIAEGVLITREQKEVQDSVNKRVKDKISTQQKEFYLREQLRAIQLELDELNGDGNEFEKYRKQVNSNPYPKHIKEKVLSEIKKLESTPSQAQEANITRTYIEWLLELPYWQYDEEKVDIKSAKKILDKDHYGLDKPKSKIIEFLAVKQQNPEAKGSILALVGPPGTGKTTMAKSIAKTLNRKLIKISLGGVKDEAEIRGHRRTYIAAMPGKIIQAMKKAKVNNPIILLDEIDKMSADYKGDPTSAMLEVLDYEQNSMFQDHYLEEEYDLSNVTFIATANYYQNIPEALIDRLDIVEVSSYTELEKIQIFKKHLLKRVKDETKIPTSLFKWTDAGIKELIRHYTIEAGVRQLHRETNTIARKILVKKLSDDLPKTLTITPALINELLGPQKFDYTKIDKSPQIGAVTGLAWTQYGGDVLPIEVTLTPGKGEVVLTGLLKEVMRESSSIALSYIKSNAKALGLTQNEFENLKKQDIHIHSPDGATPKDGPSAGVTFTTAIISAITKRKVSQYIGMTGEITLRGNVLPIGGLKEKSISAFRSGLKKIFIPKENIKDLIDIPDEVKKKLEIIPVEKYSEIYNYIFK